MEEPIYFRGYNGGMQVGINNKTINAIFNSADPLDKLPIALDAEFDSYRDQHEEECLPGTRTDLINDVTGWAVSPLGKCIFLLSGMAGTGKSTISRTIAKILKHDNLLGASFFFKRGERDRGNAMKLFPTLARQMAKNISPLMESLREAIHVEPDIVTKSLKQQFDHLLLHPIQKLDQSNHSIRNVVIVIDALDECESDNEIRTILRLLPQLRHLTTLNLRIFLTSRPELPVRLGFSEMTNHDYRDIALHEIPEAMTAYDISIFFNHRLEQIRKTQALPNDWPGSTKLQTLVKLSVPLFIFAATICRIFEDSQWDPADSLEEILKHQYDGSQFKGTYLPVLNGLLKGQTEKKKKQLVDEFHNIIGVLVLLENPLPVISLSRLIGVPEERISLRLKSLHSVLSVPEDINLPVRPFHLSFRDFLLDPEIRDENPFWVNEPEIQKRSSLRCLAVCDGLRKNICGLPSYGTRREEIRSEVISAHLPLELQYSCRYWAYHLVRSADLGLMMSKAFSFLNEHFLHWVEVMCILGYISDVLTSINLLREVSTETRDSPMSEFLHDAKRFILKNCQIAEVVPLQIYCSGLIFTPQKTMIRRLFQTEIPSWCCQLPIVEDAWNTELQTLEGHSDWVRAVAFSPDGRLLASGSNDSTIRIWDPETGVLQQTIESCFACFASYIWSVAFSPDNQLLASSSEESFVRLWDPVTGALLQILEGHLGRVYSVSFSPNGRLLASGSLDNTVRLWSLMESTPQKILQGHSGPVMSVSFSYNGLLLASGSDDKTVMIWDSATGISQQTFKGHSATVYSVAFSPNGRILASGSSDSTVRLWNIMTGTLQQTLEGHSSYVSCVLFSPDGQLLGSSSFDNTIRLWDPVTGILQQTIQSYSESTISSLAFSPDGLLLASGSHDGTIQVWDPIIDLQECPFKGHSGYIHSIAFSHDGVLVASASADSTVRLWNPATGISQLTLRGHSDAVESVVFSPNGGLVASGSRDTTIRLWDLPTGTLKHILEGHQDSVLSIAFSPNGQLLASGSDDSTVQLWDPVTGVPQQTLDHGGYVSSVVFSPDSRVLASGCEDGLIRLWDSKTGALQQTMNGCMDSYCPVAVAFSPDGQILASGYIDGSLLLWDAVTGFQQKLKADGEIRYVDFTQDSSRLITNVGAFDIQTRSEAYVPHSVSPWWEIFENKQWIQVNSENVLWLPPTYRSSCSAIKGNLIALGLASGRVLFIRFCN